MQQDEFGIYDIYTIVHVPFWQSFWFKGVIYFLCATSICLLIVYVIKRNFFSKKKKEVSPTQIVLESLGHIKKRCALESTEKLYADLGFVLRLFFTDIHKRDMLCFTEHEMVKHIDDCQVCLTLFCSDGKHRCTVCTEQSVNIKDWREKLTILLERISNIKYKADALMNAESTISDIDFIIILVHSVYFKK